MVTTMHFLFFVFLIKILVVTADFLDGSDIQLSQDELSDLSDLSEDHLGFYGSSDEASSFVDGDDVNLFADSSFGTDSFSTVGDLGLDSSSEFETSCLPESDWQPWSRLRPRDRSGVCLPNDQPSSGIGDFMNNVNGIFGNRRGKNEEESQGTVYSPEVLEPVCLPQYPNHLCCEKEGQADSTSQDIAEPIFLYTRFDRCLPGTWIFFFF